MSDYREHIVKSYDEEISKLIQTVTKMATLVEESSHFGNSLNEI